MRILILGASGGSLLSTACVAAGHDVTLVCRRPPVGPGYASVARGEGRLESHDSHGNIHSLTRGGQLRSLTPGEVDPEQYDLAVLAMAEPQYANQAIWKLMVVLAKTRTPCLSLMHMPPPPFLARFAAIDVARTREAFTNVLVWKHFDPDLVTMVSRDLPTGSPSRGSGDIMSSDQVQNFTAAAFGCEAANAKLDALCESLNQARVGEGDVAVGLRVHESSFAPLAAWSRLLAGNYRCMRDAGDVSICEAVHDELESSRAIYEAVNDIVLALGASPDDLLPFEAYADAALKLSDPSSAARALAGGAGAIERVDKLVQLIGRQLGVEHPAIDETVAAVDWAVRSNSLHAA